MVSLNLCMGNPGAIAFMANAYKKDVGRAERGFQRMQDAGICGSKLYMIWNDCCGRNMEKALDVMNEESIPVILEHVSGPRGIPFAENGED